MRKYNITILTISSITLVLSLFVLHNGYQTYQNANYDYAIGCANGDGKLTVYEKYIKDVEISNDGNVITYKNKYFKADHENKHGTYTLTNMSCVIYKSERGE